MRSAQRSAQLRTEGMHTKSSRRRHQDADELELESESESESEPDARMASTAFLASAYSIPNRERKGMRCNTLFHSNSLKRKPSVRPNDRSCLAASHTLPVLSVLAEKPRVG